MKYLKKRKPLSRRTFLKGAAGGGAAVSVGLPMLEAMLDGNGNAYAAEPAPGEHPQRYVVAFAGSSLGSNGEAPHNLFVPDVVGPDYDLKRSLQPLGDHQVKDQVSVVSGLRIPCASQNGGAVPAGGRIDQFHGGSQGPLLSGVRSTKVTSMTGPTSDQIVAEAFAGKSQYDSLTFRVQADLYIAGHSGYGKKTISFKKDGGGLDPVPARVDPQQTFNQLFGEFAATGETAAEAAARQQELVTRRSIVDAVRNSYKRLEQKLGAADRRRITQHLDEIRALEKRLESFAEEEQAAGACLRPEEPTGDWSVAGGNSDEDRQQTFDTSLAWSNETARAEILTDLLYMALVCDLTRSAALQYTFRQSFMSAYHLTRNGRNNDLHACGHSHGDLEDVADIHHWHVGHFARLVKMLGDAPEGNGSVLDNCALVYVPEGGHGFNPESGGSDDSVHSTENMALLMAGGAGGLVGGRHIVADGMHPCNVLLSGMTAVGVPNGGKLGEVSGVVDDLFQA